MRPRRGCGGGAPAGYEPQDEPAPEVPSSQKPRMGCHLIQVNWTKAHFEALKCSIMEFAEDFIHVNHDHGLSVTHKSVVSYWNQLIWRFYGEGNPTCNRLESQADSPIFYEFCIRRGLLDDHRERDEEDSGFRPSGRKVTPSENRKWLGVLIMETCPHLATTTNDHREFLIPLIGLRALEHVLYKNLVRLIVEANPGMDITYSDMQLLWDSVVHKAYHFVCACEREAKAMESMAVDGYSEEQYAQLVGEVRSVPQLTLGAKRRHNERNSENDSDDTEQSPSEQRNKRRLRGKRAHRLVPGPKSGYTAHVIAASHSGPTPSGSPPKTPAAFTEPAVLLRSNVESQDQATKPELNSTQTGQGRGSGSGSRMIQTKRSSEGGARVRGGLAGRGVLKSHR